MILLKLYKSKNMKKFNIYIIAVLTVLAFTSCDKFLDEKPSNSADASTSILTAKDAQVMINGLMRKMSSSSYYGRNFIMYGDAKGGDLGIVSQGRGMDAFYTFNHSATSNSYSGFWSQMYHCITQINNLLENIEKLEVAGSSEKFDQIKAEALTARACIYFDLVRIYGQPYSMNKSAYGVPVVTALLDATAQPTRNTVDEVYTQIDKDLKAAEPLFTTKKKSGYFSYYANLAIRARMHLYKEEYANALAAAKEIIDSKAYTLYTNSNWYDSWTSEFGSESIFEIAMYPDEADLGTSSLGFYLMRYGKKKNAMGWFMASNYFLNRLGEDPDDIRWDIMDYDEISKDRFGACEKYGLGDKEGSTTAVNIKVIRLSEIYLIAAEAALLSGDAASAATYLNAIRQRSPSLDPATASNVTRDMIFDERSKELFAEGHRFFDMMRANKSVTFNDEMITPAVTITHREKTIDRTFFKTILPIAKGEIDANPAIGAQQNPGY